MKTKIKPKIMIILSVATLTLGSRPRQGVARLQAKRKTRESHHMLLGVPKSEGMNLHTPK
jgi:hypothetical protein